MSFAVRRKGTGRARKMACGKAGALDTIGCTCVFSAEDWRARAVEPRTMIKRTFVVALLCLAGCGDEVMSGGGSVTVADGGVDLALGGRTPDLGGGGGG